MQPILHGVPQNPLPRWTRNGPSLRHRFLAMAAGLLLATALHGWTEDTILFEQKLAPVPYPVAVPVSVGGESYSFYFDTGAPMPAFDETLRKLLPGESVKTNVGVAGRVMSMDVFAAPPLQVGTWKLHPPSAMVTDLSAVRQLGGRDIRGVIGCSAWARNCASFDFDQARFRILESSGAPAKMQAVDLNQSNAHEFVPEITVALSDRRVNLMVDTGYNDTIGLSHDTYLYLQDWGFIARQDTYARGSSPGGIQESTHGVFTQGTLLGMSLKGVPVEDTGPLNVIGMNILVNFNFMIDLGGGKLYYQKRTGLPPINPSRTLGAMFAFRDGKVLVAKLRPGGGPAQTAGIKEGDVLVSLDSVKAGDLDTARIYEICQKRARTGGVIEATVIHPGSTAAESVHLEAAAQQWVFPPENLR